MRSILFALIVVVGISCTTQETQVTVETPAVDSTVVVVDTTAIDSVAADTTTAQ
jgi:hypothetical protein